MTGLSVTVNGIFTVLGVDGDAVAVVILAYSIWVKTRSEDKYVKTYFKQAKELYNESNEDVTARLQNYFGVLRREATAVLSIELGTVLLALATFLKFIVDIVTGVIG